MLVSVVFELVVVCCIQSILTAVVTALLDCIAELLYHLQLYAIHMLKKKSFVSDIFHRLPVVPEYGQEGYC